MKKKVDNVEYLWYIINALQKKMQMRKSSLKTEQNVNFE